MPVAPAPATLFIEVTTECQLRCQQCHYWTTKERAGALSTAEKAALLTSYLRLNPAGAVVFTGGEPLLHVEQILELSAMCRAAGVLSVLNTNAAAITPKLAEELVERGPTCLVVSLDSHEEALHDQIRGVPGTFRQALRALDDLLRFRRQHGAPTRVYLSSILCALNVSTSGNFVRFAKRLGVDGVTFQALEKTFALAGARDMFFERNWFSDIASAHAAIDRLAAEFLGDPFLLLSAQDFRWLKAYVASPDELPEPVCASHERNLWIDMYGEARLCAYMNLIPNHSSLGNIRDQSLAELWNGDAATGARPIMEACRFSCGMLNCHRRKT